MQNEDYVASGAKIAGTADAFGSDIVLKVRPPDVAKEVSMFRDGARSDTQPFPHCLQTKNSDCITSMLTHQVLPFELVLHQIVSHQVAVSDLEKT